jgi:hypothetical protein
MAGAPWQLCTININEPKQPKHLNTTDIQETINNYEDITLHESKVSTVSMICSIHGLQENNEE